MCGQLNVGASAGNSTGQNTDKEHTPNPRIGIKIPDPAGKQIRASRLEGSDSSDHATATDNNNIDDDDDDDNNNNNNNNNNNEYLINALLKITRA